VGRGEGRCHRRGRPAGTADPHTLPDLGRGVAGGKPESRAPARRRRGAAGRGGPRISNMDIQNIKEQFF